MKVLVDEDSDEQVSASESDVPIKKYVHSIQLGIFSDFSSYQGKRDDCEEDWWIQFQVYIFCNHVITRLD